MRISATLTFIGAALALTPAVYAAPFDCGGTCYYVQASGNSNGTQAFDQSTDDRTSASATLNFVQPGYGYATGSASADLATGSLHAAIDTNVGGAVNANFYELLKFDLPDGMTQAIAHVTWTIEGTTAFNGGSPNGMGAYFRLVNRNIGLPMVEFADLNFDYDNPLWQQFVSNGFHSFTFSGDMVVNEINQYAVNSSVSLGISGRGNLDYGNTSFFNIELPEGVSLISSSGVLLSDPIESGVPEPTAWALMVSGFGLAGAAMRRKRTGLRAA